MKIARLSLAALCACFFSSQILAQGELPVNMYTGQPGIAIPMYNLRDHDLSEVIELQYNLGDLRVGSDHTYGVGWSLSCGNQQVSRVVRGLPDDIGHSGEPRKGWLYSIAGWTAGANFYAITGFADSSDLVAGSSCSDETSDYNFLSSANYKYDTEPDLFSYSVGGISGQFVFGNDGVVSLIPYQEIKIKPIFKTYPTDLKIIGWTITTANGVVYTLQEELNISRSYTKSSSDNEGVDEDDLRLFDRDYNYYKDSTSYDNGWLLSKVKSPVGAYMTFTYDSTTDVSVSEKRVGIMDATWTGTPGTTATRNDFIVMNGKTHLTSRRLMSITTSSGYTASFATVNSISITDSARPGGPFKKFLMSYSSGFLTSVTESDGTGCTQMPPYKMYYINQGAYPLENSTGIDFWGFYNGASNYDQSEHPTSFPTIYVYPDEEGRERYRIHQIPSYPGNEFILAGNANRVTNPNAIVSGTISRLVYPAGGETDIAFESNTFYDAKAQQNQYGGGLRVKKVTYYDGVNPAAVVTKNFSYLDDSAHSTGRLITRPSFAIPVAKYIAPGWDSHTVIEKTYDSLTTDTQKWRSMTVITNFDMSTQETTLGSPVGYTKVKVARPGSGYVIHTYAIPGSYADAATGSGATDWIPTPTKFARYSSCPDMGIIAAGDIGIMASIPNTFYDYERGLLKTKTEYNEAGKKVRFTADTYQYIYGSGTSPKNVVGIAFDRYGNSDVNIYLFGKYTHLTNVDHVLAAEAVTTYDESDTTKKITETTQYYYTSTYHKLTTKMSRVGGDGVTRSVLTKYSGDFQSGSPSGVPMQMIKQLNDSSRIGEVIEQQQTVKESGSGTEKTIGASLVKYDLFNSRPQPRYVLAFRTATPVTDFAAATVTSNVFVNDSRYKTVQTVFEYGSYDIPLSSTGTDSVMNGTLWGYSGRMPVAQVQNAKVSNVAFSDFETTTDASFTLANAYYGAGRTGKNSLSPYATLSRTVAKTTNTSSYLFTTWVKNTNPIALTVTVKNTDNTSSSTTNVPCPASPSKWQYITKLIDVSGVQDAFKVAITGVSISPPAGSSSSLDPVIDDVGFYPSHAVLASNTFDIPFGVSSSTSAGGITSFTTYDGLGRTKWLLDKDGNIRKRYAYQMEGQVAPGPVAAITPPPGALYVLDHLQFSAVANNCISGTLYSWKFDEDASFSTPSTSLLSPTETYATSDTGTHFVQLVATHPDFTTSDTTELSFTVGWNSLSLTVDVDGDDSGSVTVEEGTVTFTAHATNGYGDNLKYVWSCSGGCSGTTNTTTSLSNSFIYHVNSGTPGSFNVTCTVTDNDDGTRAPAGVTKSITVSR